MKKVLKSTGLQEPFSQKKLMRSIERSGLHPKECKFIAEKIKKSVANDVTSKAIFKKTQRLIKAHSPLAAVHYSLKQSLLELGPTGYEFENFVAKYFEELGYETYVGIILQGGFVRHEVDVVASKKNYQIYSECKFHNHTGTKNDIKTVLYVKARWDDLKNGPDGKYLKEFYLFSNTAFTLDAIQYSKGAGLKLMGVNAPEDESFIDKIKKHKLYPITSLKRLKKIYCQELLRKKIILCKELLDQETLLIKMGLTEKEIHAVFNDINKLLNYEN